MRYSLRSTRTVLKPISSSRAPFPTRPSTAPPRRYRQRRFHPPHIVGIVLVGIRSLQVQGVLRYLVLQKSIVYTIFRIGHWSKEAADKWELDRTQHPSGAADSRATTKAQIAQQARRDAHYALQRYTKYRYNRALAGICDACGADTAKQHMHRIKCWVCSNLVCQSEKCRVAEHSLCTECRPRCCSRPDQTGDRDNLHFRIAGILPERDQPEVCDSCNLEKRFARRSRAFSGCPCVVVLHRVQQVVVQAVPPASTRRLLHHLPSQAEPDRRPLGREPQGAALEQFLE